MRYELDDHTEGYNSLTYENWCDLLSTIEVKYERKMAAGHIKNIASARAASLSDRKKSARITRRNKARTGVSNSHKTPRRAHDRHHGTHRYCILYKKSGMTKRKYMSHSTEDWAGMCTNHHIKDGMGGPDGSRNHAVQQHKKSVNKWKKDIKALKKQNKIIYSIAKKSGSRRELHKIKKIRKEALKDTYSSSEDWDSDSSLAIDSSLDKEGRPAGCKEINRSDHLVTDNIKDYNDQYNDAIDNEPTLDNSSFNIYSGTIYPLPIVTVSLRRGKKHRATVVERKIWSNRVEYSTAAGMYCTTHDVKVPFCMPEFSGSKIINHRFHVDNDEGESGI